MTIEVTVFSVLNRDASMVCHISHLRVRWAFGFSVINAQLTIGSPGNEGRVFGAMMQTVNWRSASGAAA